MLNWFKNLMKDRYGGDQLSIFLLVIALILSFLGSIFAWAWMTIVSYLPLIFSIYRIFSKDREKRSMENYRFAILMSPVYKRYYKIKTAIKERKDYRIFSCPNCQTKVRVPKKKGKVKITCPKCQTTWHKKT